MKGRKNIYICVCVHIFIFTAGKPPEKGLGRNYIVSMVIRKLLCKGHAIYYIFFFIANVNIALI